MRKTIIFIFLLIYSICSSDKTDKLIASNKDGTENAEKTMTFEKGILDRADDRPILGPNKTSFPSMSDRDGAK